jgi:hypothetical protein
MEVKYKCYAKQGPMVGQASCPTLSAASSGTSIERKRWGQALAPVIPATQKVEIRRITVQGQPKQIGSKTPSQPISWAVCHAYHSSYMAGINRRIIVQACPGKKHMTLFGKIDKSRKGLGMTQVVECLSSKCWCLSSNPSTVNFFLKEDVGVEA